MNLISFSHGLEQATNPHYLYYHPIQISLFASLTYIGTTCLTSVPPKRSITFMILAYTISQLTTPLFCTLFEPYQEAALVPLIGQVIQLSASLLLAKMICWLIGQALSLKEIRKIGAAFFITLYVSRFVLLKFRQLLSINKFKN